MRISNSALNPEGENDHTYVSESSLEKIEYALIFLGYLHCSTVSLAKIK